MSAFVIMSNDYPESVALSQEAADAEVLRLKRQHGEPEDVRAAYEHRYIRAVPVPVTGGEAK